MNLLFDPQDHALIAIVEDVLTRPGRPPSLASLMAPAMHPHGIKELAAPRALRIAYAVASLLGSLTGDAARERLAALTLLRDEVLLTADVRLPRTTARVLMQIMKDLIRHRGDTTAQLRLAHAFRATSTGQPRVVRRMLARYHLLEMPEDWNQVAFDDHVHDASTKGRKTPTHLVMDAWIKGIRHLTVVYYNFVSPAVADELLQAGSILDMTVRIAIEVRARFRDRYVRFLWEPFQRPRPEDFRRFLAAPAVQAQMQAGEEVSRYHQRYVFGALEAYNAIHRHAVAEAAGIEAPAIDRHQFLASVGAGQPSLLHLARCIEASLRQAAAGLPPEERQAALARLEDLTPERLIHDYLQPCRNPHLPDPNLPADGPDVPERLRLAPAELLRRLADLHPASRFVLDPSDLSVADALEVIAQCQGLVTDVELFSLKDFVHGRPSPQACAAVDITPPQHTAQRLAELLHALGDEHIIALKRVVRGIVWDYHQERQALARRLEGVIDAGERQALAEELAAMDARCRDLVALLENLPALHRAYAGRPLGMRVGSRSTGQSRGAYGMGLAVVDTLPRRARAAIHDPSNPQRRLLPLRAHLVRHVRQPWGPAGVSWLARLLGLAPPPAVAWTVERLVWSHGPGNVVTLGGLAGSPVPSLAERLSRWECLNSTLKNALKVLAGFLPAFLTFLLTKDWWVLAWGGAFLWFAITGVRNVLQAVLGGGGLRRPSQLPWRSLVSANRIADSLFYTGFSVPLLDWVVKTLLLDHTLGITVASHPVLLYAVMAAANGLYLFSHNLWRGLPRAAAVGNLFRSLLSIPVALAYNALALGILRAMDVAEAEALLQAGAAIVSKLASDTVAGGIEGLADRAANIEMRRRDYRTKLAALFNTFARLDALFPDEDVLEMLQTPKAVLDTLDLEARELEQLLIVNALDLMYFWYYQPRARSALRQMVRQMTQEEWLILFRSQLVLRRFREISRMFVDGLVGKDFAKALAFYLDHWEAYLRDMERLGVWRRVHATLPQAA